TTSPETTKAARSVGSGNRTSAAMERKNPAGITSNPAYFMALSFRLGSRQVTGWTAAYRTEVGCGGPQGMNDLLKKSVFETPLRILKHLIVTIRLRERDGPSVGCVAFARISFPPFPLEASSMNFLDRVVANPLGISAAHVVSQSLR